MADSLGGLDNRELAGLVWLLIGLAAALRSADVRTSLARLGPSLLSLPILIVCAIAAAYVAGVVLGLQELEFWNLNLTKDTVIWFIGPGMLMLFDHGEAVRNLSRLIPMVTSRLRLALVLEFLVSFYVFHLAIELVLVPIAVLLTGMLVVVESRPDLSRAKGPLEVLIAVVGLSVLGYALAMLVRDGTSFFTGDTARLFALPVVLTLSFLPFIIALVFYGRYEHFRNARRRRAAP